MIPIKEHIKTGVSMPYVKGKTEDFPLFSEIISRSNILDVKAGIEFNQKNKDSYMRNIRREISFKEIDPLDDEIFSIVKKYNLLFEDIINTDKDWLGLLLFEDIINTDKDWLGLEYKIYFDNGENTYFITKGDENIELIINEKY